MAVVSIAGSQFTFKVGATDYSAQVTGGTITTTASINRVKTLTDTAYPLSDKMHEVSIEYLYDEETGVYGALETAALAGTGLTVEIKGGDAKWSGTLYVNGNEVKFAADGVGEASSTFVGLLTLADAP